MRLSKAKTQEILQELYGVNVSMGAITQCEKRMSKALYPALEHATDVIRASALAHVDESTWRTCGVLRWLWTLGSGPLSVFRITETRKKEHAQALLEDFGGLLHSDRYGGYLFYDTKKRQVCWAHIHREVRAIAQFQTQGTRIAKRLDKHITAMFTQWGRIRDGTLPEPQQTFVMNGIQERIEAELERGQCSASKRLRTLCKGLLKLRAALWTYRRIPGAEPTNNRAERDLRHAVLWRSSSHGTQSKNGERYVECMLSVNASLRAQNRSIFDFLHQSLEAFLWGKNQPLLTP